MKARGENCPGKVIQLFADETAVAVDFVEKSNKLVFEFGKVCEMRKLKINVGN